MASKEFARLREQTMGSSELDEAVTVNTRALIDKVLARYSGEWTTLRELIQNAADAQATQVTIRFETTPSATVPLPQTQDPSELLKHAVLHHTLKTLVVSNDGELFKETDWQRLKRIAEGNPDETKIGAFGVGFYSVFADCESPFVSSGNQNMAFYWKKDSLFTRRGTLPDDQSTKGTTFLLDYRSQTTPVPALLSLCQFLATSLTFVGLQNIKLQLDDWDILSLSKKMAPGSKVKIPSDVNPKTRDGLMKITDVEYQNAQIDARWMNVVGWNKRSPSSATSITSAQNDSGGLSLRNFFGKFTGSSTNSSTTRKLQREEEALQQAIVEDLVGFSQSTVFIRISTVNVQTFVSRTLHAELERATKKPPPKYTKISILTSSYDEATASSGTASGSSSQKSTEIFSSVLPTKNGKIFIGFPTAQTTGLLAHISAPSVIPTVERESIDLNARYVRDWNIEMLRVAGIACRIAYTGDMAELKAKLDRTVRGNGRSQATKDDVSSLLPAAVHTYRQYNYEESTPSSKVGEYIEEAFWMCNQKATIDVLSTRGVLPSHKVRVATEDLSFVEGIPVVPDELMEKASEFLTKLRDFGMLSNITTADIKQELEAQALSEKQVTELVKWACKKVSQQEMDAGDVKKLFDGTIASVSEDFLSISPTPVLQLGQMTTFINSAKIPAELPSPPQTIPFRLTKGLSPMQLSSIGWEELQIVPWLRWIIDSNGQGFGSGHTMTDTPAVASQVLPVISKGWDTLSQSSKQTVQELLIPRTVIPTKLGMRKPAQAYFGNVKLFDDLPTIVSLQGVKEKFLSALGVRKTVELATIFERLMAKSSTPAIEEGRWSHVDLIKYLVSVKDDIPSDDIKRLQQAPICLAEAGKDEASRNKLFRLSELYEPGDDIRKLGLPILQWPGQFRANSPEGRFLKLLGLQPYPSVPVLVDILAKASASSELQQSTLNYWIINAYQNGYNKYQVAEIDKPFLPVQPFAGEANNLIAKPSQCYANPKASVLRFRILREDLHPHHAIFGVAQNPPIEACAERLVKLPPVDMSAAQTLFGYFAARLGEIGPNGNLAERLGTVPIVPIVSKRRIDSKGSRIRYVAPRACFLGDGDTYGDIFDFVDFGHEANTFLLRVGCKHEPSAAEIASMLVTQPARLLDTLGTEKYLQLLRKIAEHAAPLKKDKALWQQLKRSPCLLAEKLVSANVPDEKHDYDDEDAMIKEYSLATANEMVLVDDFVTYRLFQSSLLAGPQEEILETLYASLDTPWLSGLVEDDKRMGQPLRDQSAGAKLQNLLVERCRLFLHDHQADAIRHDAKWLEQYLNVKVTEFLQVTRKLTGYRVQFVEKRTAALHRESKREATLFITARYDLYEVSRAVMNLLLKRPRQQDFLALETILESDLRRLKTKGYNVDRILRAKAAESRVAESERQKREEEQRRLMESEATSRLTQQPSSQVSAGVAPPQMKSLESPERSLSIPGAFDTPEQPSSSGRGKKPTSIFNTISKHLGMNGASQAGQQMQNLLTNGDNPPPYTPKEPRALTTTSGTERVSSPRDLQANLESAIKATREHNSSSIFSQPDTREIKESPSYCDSKPGHDLRFAAELGNGIKTYLSRSNADPNSFLTTHQEALAYFVVVLTEVASVFELPTQTINIFHDETGASIAFNSNGSIFCNLRYFMQLHLQDMTNPEGRVEATVYWFVTMCHELAHNLVSNHDSQHSFYTESFVAHYFRRMVWLASKVTAVNA